MRSRIQPTVGQYHCGMYFSATYPANKWDPSSRKRSRWDFCSTIVLKCFLFKEPLPLCTHPILTLAKGKVKIFLAALGLICANFWANIEIGKPCTFPLGLGESGKVRESIKGFSLAFVVLVQLTKRLRDSIVKIFHCTWKSLSL